MKQPRSIGKKKGQIAGQIFIYIMAIIVIGAMVVIGAKAIIDVGKKTCNAEQINFKADIESKIEQQNSPGSVKPKSFRAPCDYEKLCFVAAADIGISEFTCPNKVIQDSVLAGVKDNIFVVSDKSTIAIGRSDLISLKPDPAGDRECLCIDKLNGNFNIRFNGLGATTEINKG